MNVATGEEPRRSGGMPEQDMTSVAAISVHATAGAVTWSVMTAARPEHKAAALKGIFDAVEKAFAEAGQTDTGAQWFYRAADRLVAKGLEGKGDG